ncbi:MAG TPA: pitrilysin family protein [Chthoniobacterales bacterium]|nr:pitrilysin family protein [Chthoniobacterales bacterium]
MRAGRLLVLFSACLTLVASGLVREPEAEIKKLSFNHTNLQNGLEIYSIEDHSSPTVAVQVWYHVGSKDDPDGRSGFAHLFEHMMFKGNEHLTPNTFEELTENVGGENNAYTAPDVTVYHEVVPSNYLEPVLWAEAERMSSLALNDANFNSERDVVKEEYRQRILANPYGEFSLAIDQESFAAHPYKRPSIGNITELDAAQLPEVKAFHSTFYRPDNATLVVVGDFKASDLETWTKKYFGPIPKPTTKIPRVAVVEPPRKEDRHEVLSSAKAPLPAFAVTYLAPSVRSKDEPALDLADEILSGGQSSRLYQSLVYEQQVAQRASFDADLREDLGLLTFRVIVASGKSLPEAEKSLNDQIEKILRDGVTEAELDKAKNRFLTGKLMERETNNGKASALGEAAVIYRDPNHINTDLARYQAVTTSEVKDVLSKYLAGKKQIMIEYLPDAKKEAGKPEDTKKP